MIKIILFLLSLIIIFSAESTNITFNEKYNFGNNQNPEIDKLYNHLLGRHLYFITTGESKTMFKFVIYPSLTLQISLNMYTNNENIINALDNGQYIYFGVDLRIKNTDISRERYSTDVIVCGFTKEIVKCFDYVFDTVSKIYIKNENGAISLNNMIPLGFENMHLNVLSKNVMDYKSYYSLKLEKSYPVLFDNITMFNYINYVSTDRGDRVSGFYGTISNIDDLNNFQFDTPLIYQTEDFDDGSGLINDNAFYIKKLKWFYITFIAFCLA